MCEALQREMYGLLDERQRLLDEALALEPDHAMARWQAGQIGRPGQWISAEQVQETPRLRKKREVYEQVRSKTPVTAEGQLALANWCAERDLHLQEQAHLNRVIQLAPDHFEARFRLGYVRAPNGWVQREAVWGEARDRQEVAESLKQWSSPLQDIRQGLLQRSQQKRETARERMFAIQDPAAIPAIESFLASDNGPAASLAVEALDNMTQHEASLALARIAMLHPVPAISEEALRRLQKRPFEGFVPALLAELTSPIESQYMATAVNGRFVYRHAFYQEGQSEGALSVNDAVYTRYGGHQIKTVQLDDPIGKEVARKYNLRQITGEEANRLQRENPVLQEVTQKEAAQRAAAADMAQLGTDRRIAQWHIAGTIRSRELQREMHNAAIQPRNDRITRLLRAVSGRQDLDAPRDWWNWWNEQNERQGETPKSLRTNYSLEGHQVGVGPQLAVAEVAPRQQYGSGYRPRVRWHNCFVAGTPVLTVAGPKRVEEMNVGDIVIAQDVDTGQLDYRPVVTTTRREAAEIVRITLADGEVLETTGGHAFWISGEGWALARELQSGMLLHTLRGATPISQIEKAGTQPTYNLVVDGFHTYFVGSTHILCHDVEFFEATNATLPGFYDE